MNIKDLQPASQLAHKYGVKCLVYGGPGTGKTPMIATAPRPVACVVEPGMLSMRAHTTIPCFDANSVEKIEEFFKWALGSKEANNFDTICIDSASQLAELYLAQELKNNRDGRMAYGQMAVKVIQRLSELYYMQNKNIYITAKQVTVDENGLFTKSPYFPGKDLNIKVPHLYDEVLQISEVKIPAITNPVIALRCKGTFGILARDRSMRLDEFEQTNLTHIFNKCAS